MYSIIRFLKEKNILGKKGPIISTIDSLSLKAFVDIANEITQKAKSNKEPVKDPIFSHAASLSLGGSPIECAYIDCRIERIHNLARFALLYSNKVFIDNFLDGYSDIDSNEDIAWAKQRFIDDLLVVHEIRPLIEKGFIEFFSPEKDVCFSCQARRFLGDGAARKFNRSYSKLKSDFLRNMAVEARLNPEGIDFDCDGPAPYFDHAMVSTSLHVPDALINRPTILKKIENGNTISISKALIKDLGLHGGFAHKIVTNAIFGLATSNCLNTTFLTENDLHIQFLNTLHSNSEVSRRNLIAEKYLTTIVPFLEEIELKNLIKLRRREEEAFLLFRQALNKSIDEFLSLPEDFSEKHAQSIYADIIAPSLAHLDTKVKKAKRDLISKPFRSLTGIVGIISFGLLTGLVPSDVSEIVKVLGILKFGSDFIKDTMALGDEEKNIKSDHFYFLWKVRDCNRVGPR